MSDGKLFKFNDESIARGEARDVRLKVSETYTGEPVTIPVRILRGPHAGPVVFVTAAVHGNEIIGTGIIHELTTGESAAGGLTLARGTLILAPVVNSYGFEHGDRYLPDRRDLNRSFPGSATGNLSQRLAHVLFEQIVKRCHYGIDLHSAAEPRTNFPNVRGDLTLPEVRRIAKAFGCELMVNGKGPEGSLRREACHAGCPTIILEAGEPRKAEPAVLRIGVRGVRNVLIELGMIEAAAEMPLFQTRVDKTRWVRAQVGGLLRFHVAPGDVVDAGQAVATNIPVFGREQHVVTAPTAGIVLGMTTLPVVKPGEPICHLAIPRLSLRTIRESLSRAPQAGLHQRARTDLASSIAVTHPAAPLTGEEEEGV